MRNDLLDAIRDSVPIIVIAPHLDDAVLSCGALMTHASRRTSVTVVTLFTEAGEAPYTLSARRYLKQVGAEDATSLYAQRRAEDHAVLSSAGIRCVHAGLTEALFRRHCPPRRSLRGRLLPEFDHIYPVYRVHVTAGRVAAADLQTLHRAQEFIGRLASASRSIVLAPLGVGGHVDHVLTRSAAEQSGASIAYYSDFPYNQRGAPRTPAHGGPLTEIRWHDHAEAKAELVRGYGTQVQALFADGFIPLVPEIYLLPADMGDLARNAGDTAGAYNT